jgi:23S rRNA U2552 (ribose-2'-O)-methylase RlmE/FtsJ
MNNYINMSYFLFPYIHYRSDIENKLVMKYEKECPTQMINKSLYLYLEKIKGGIDTCANLWEKYKKYTNPYEYIHTPTKKGGSPICSIKPLSRSYFKMIEIVNMLNLTEEFPETMKTFHLAEGPGGFIEAMCKLRNNIYDTYYGMTLQDKIENSIPGWKKSETFLLKHSMVKIENGADGTGDLTRAENLRYCWEHYHNSMDLITGDGGFDFSVDFNRQEVSSTKLIFCQIAYAIAMQAKGGTFIIKFFDTFTSASIDLLFLLSILYKDVYFVKPYTSRCANSEKYVVCKYFKLENSMAIVQKIYSILANFEDDKFIHRILDIDIPKLYVTKIEEYNAIYGQRQLETISNTLQIIQNPILEKLQDLNKKHIQKCKRWCQKHDMPYHNEFSK